MSGRESFSAAATTPIQRLAFKAFQTESPFTPAIMQRTPAVVAVSLRIPSGLSAADRKGDISL
jgi:hypothetical protein